MLGGSPSNFRRVALSLKARFGGLRESDGRSMGPQATTATMKTMEYWEAGSVLNLCCGTVRKLLDLEGAGNTEDARSRPKGNL